jgi:hypothetical protein
VSERPEEPRAPEPQDTAERSALPLPLPEDAPASGDGSEPVGDAASPPPFGPAPSAPAAAQDEGLPAELLVGAAFVGGLALAFLIRRLGS